MLSFDYRPGVRRDRGTHAWLPDAALVRERGMLALRARPGCAASGRIVESSSAPEASVEHVVLTRAGREVRVSVPRRVAGGGAGTDAFIRMSSPLRIFTYGTLLREERSHALIAERAPQIVAAHTLGRLLHLGEYPGLIRGAQRVCGELVTLDDPAEALPALDEHEGFLGYGKSGSLYRRIVIAAKTSTGTGTLAWAYRYLGASKGVPLIDSGDWRRR